MTPRLAAALLAIAVVAVAVALGGCGPSDAEQAASTFRAAESVLAPTTDPNVLLARCDDRLTRCERDRVGVDFLAAAYIALWVILVAFFFIVRARQRRLTLEMAELRARLARLQDRPPS